MIKLLLSVVVFMFTAVGFSQDHAQAHAKKIDPKICSAAQKDLAEGDVVFISNHNYLFRRVEKDTLTWTSHVGITFKNDLDEWVVYESTWPKSKITPFCEFLSRSFEARIDIRRFETPLIASQIRVMKMAATRQLDISYDQGFDYNDPKTSFCSKYVYNTYQSIGIDMGQLETFQQVFDANPDMDLSFWKTWFMGNIPYERVTISPAIQILDAQFHSVFKNGLPPGY